MAMLDKPVPWSYIETKISLDCTWIGDCIGANYAPRPPPPSLGKESPRGLKILKVTYMMSVVKA